MNDNRSFDMARRLKKLRKDRGLSHTSLSTAIKEKYGISIGKDSLQNYEKTDPFHDKAYSNNGMKAESVRCLAEFYGVSADYILGLTNDPNRNPSAVDELGLNPTVVWGIKELNNRKGNDDSTKGPSTIDVLNEFLEKSLRSVLFYEMVRELKASVDREHNAKLSTIIPDGLAEFAAANPEHEYMVVEAMLRSKIREEFPELNDRFLVTFGARSLKPRVDEICDLFREMLENITGYKQLKEG